jgi:hypothetical protein
MGDLLGVVRVEDSAEEAIVSNSDEVIQGASV